MCRKRWKKTIVTLLLLMFTVLQPHRSFSLALLSDKLTEDPIGQKILQRANQVNESTIEPRIDPVWKLIPGYNGICLDIEETYKHADRHNGTFHPIYKEIRPSKKLQDLMPQPIYRGNSKKPFVALMINVAWGNEYLESILKTLEKHNVKATFFLDGSWLKKNPELGKKIASQHHEIGSHAYSHPMMSKLTRDQIEVELDRTNQIIEKVLQRKVTLFAPPAGDYSQLVVDLAWARQMYTILWTLDTVDWRNPPVEKMVDKIVTHVQPGHLILMHPTPSTAEGLEAMILGIQRKGLYIDVVSEVISSERVPNLEMMPDF